MGWERWSRRVVGIVAGVVFAASGAAQDEPPTTPPRPSVAAPTNAPAPAKSDAAQKRGAPDAPTHAPQPALPPLAVWQHVANGNNAAVEALAAQKPLPK